MESTKISEKKEHPSSGMCLVRCSKTADRLSGAHVLPCFQLPSSQSSTFAQSQTICCSIRTVFFLFYFIYTKCSYMIEERELYSASHRYVLCFYVPTLYIISKRIFVRHGTKIHSVSGLPNFVILLILNIFCCTSA